MIPKYLNSKPHSGYPASHHLYDKKAFDKAREQEYSHTFNLKHVWVKNATGLGITEFLLRFMVWLCLRNDDYRN